MRGGEPKPIIPPVAPDCDHPAELQAEVAGEPGGDEQVGPHSHQQTLVSPRIKCFMKGWYKKVKTFSIR